MENGTGIFFKMTLQLFLKKNTLNLFVRDWGEKTLDGSMDPVDTL